MSRIGKLPISIPQNVNVYLEDDHIVVKGKEGELRKQLVEQITFTIREENNRSILMIGKNKQDNKTNELYGLYRTLINNMIIGVNTKFSKYLELKGVGYRSQLENKILTLNLGYSHPIKFVIPDSISIEIENNTIIKISGIDKQLVGEVASRIRNFRLPEPYKGKGIHYRGEYIKLKAGKTGKK
uniref:Ribosomal protein L6 n=1 Tax=Galdieria sulphuraria TaxID=130081 RepID=A0A075VZW8_GALSU|nr:ribosomal protein L6 [Galdieria sulphuraria]AIG92506.1 ribosomal protein L6 [Galdieria sulphuraria]